MEPSPVWFVLVLLIISTPTCDSHKEKYLVYFKNGSDKIPITVEMDLREKVAYAYSDGPDKVASRSLYDYKANMVAYKDHHKKVCFLEHLDERSLNYDRRLLQSLKHQVLLESPDVLLWEGSPLTRRQVVHDAGRRIGHFCAGFLTYKITSDSTSGRVKRGITDGGNYQRTYSHHEQLTQSYSKFGHEAVTYNGNGQKPEASPSFLVPNGTLPKVEAGKMRITTRSKPVKIQPRYIWSRRSVRNGKMSRITRGLPGKSGYVPAHSQGSGTAGQIISHITHGGSPGATGRFDLSSSHAVGSGTNAGGYSQSGIGSQAYSGTVQKGSSSDGYQSHIPQGYPSGQYASPTDYGQIRTKSDKRYPASAIDYGLQARPAPAAGAPSSDKIKPAIYPGTEVGQHYVPGAGNIKSKEGLPGSIYPISDVRQQGISIPLRMDTGAKKEGKSYPSAGFANQQYQTGGSSSVGSAGLSGKNKESLFPNPGLSPVTGLYQPGISVPLRGTTNIQDGGRFRGSDLGTQTGQYPQNIGDSLQSGFKIKNKDGQFPSSGSVLPGQYQTGLGIKNKDTISPSTNFGAGQYPSNLNIPLQSGIKNKDGVYPGTGLGVQPGQYPSGLNIPSQSGIKNKDGLYPGSGLGVQPGQYPSSLLSGIKNKDGVYPGTGLGVQPGQYPSSLQSGIKNKDGVYPGTGLGVQPGQYPSGLSIPSQSGIKNKDGLYPGSGSGIQPGQYPSSLQSGIKNKDGIYRGSGLGVQPGQYPSGLNIPSQSGIKNKDGVYPGSGLAVQPGQYPSSLQSGIKNKDGVYPGSGLGIQPGQYSGLNVQPGQYSGLGVQPGQYPSSLQSGIKNKDGVYPGSGLGVQHGQYPSSLQSGTKNKDVAYPGSDLGLQPGQYPSGLTSPSQSGIKNKDGGYPGSGLSVQPGQYPGIGLGIQPGQYQSGFNVPLQTGTGVKNKHDSYHGTDQTLPHQNLQGNFDKTGGLKRKDGRFPIDSSQSIRPTFGVGPDGQISGFRIAEDGTIISPGVGLGQAVGSGGVGGVGVGLQGLGQPSAEIPGVSTLRGVGMDGTGYGVDTTGYGAGGSGIYSGGDSLGIRPGLYGTGVGATQPGLGGLSPGTSGDGSLSPGTILGSRGADSGLSSQSQVQLDARQANAGSSAQGAYGGGTTQSQVQGGATQNGTFQAQAQSSFLLGSSQSQTQGSEAGAQSSASSQLSDLGQSQTQAQLTYDRRSAQATAQTTSRLGSISTQSQGGRQGGQASSQAQGRGGTSSSAQVGFDESARDGSRNGQSNPDNFSGKATAVSQGGFQEGQSQTQVSGDLADGNKYSATAQGSYGEKEYPEGSPLAVAFPGTGQDFRSTAGFPTSSLQQPSLSGPDSLQISQTTGFQPPAQGISGVGNLYPSTSPEITQQSHLTSGLGTPDQFASRGSTDHLGRRNGYGIPISGDFQIRQGEGTVGQSLQPSPYLFGQDQNLNQGLSIPVKEKNKPLTDIQIPHISQYPTVLQGQGPSQKIKPYRTITPSEIPGGSEGLGGQLGQSLPFGYDGKVKPSSVVNPVINTGGLQPTEGLASSPYGFAPGILGHQDLTGANVMNGASIQTLPTKVKDTQGLNLQTQQHLQGLYGSSGIPGIASTLQGPHLGASAANLPSGIIGQYGNIPGQGLSPINPLLSSGSAGPTIPLHNVGISSGYSDASRIPAHGITGIASVPSGGIIGTAQTDRGVSAQVGNSQGEVVRAQGDPTMRQAQAQGIFIGSNGFRTRIINGRTGQQPQITQIAPDSYITRTSDSGPFSQSQEQSVHLGKGLLGDSKISDSSQLQSDAAVISQNSESSAGESSISGKLKQDSKGSRNHTRHGSHHTTRLEQRQPNGRRRVRNRASQLLRSLPLIKETGSQVNKKASNCSYTSCSSAYRLIKTVKICRKVMCT